MTDMAPVSYQEHERLIELLQAKDHIANKLAIENQRLKKSLSGMDDSDPLAEDVKELLQLWKDVVKGGNKAVLADLTSTRAPKVKAALKRRKKKGDPEICRKAILGVVYDDWAMGRIKKSQGKCFNDIAEHILNTDEDIEKFAGLYDQHQGEQPVVVQRPGLRLVKSDPVFEDVACPECLGTLEDRDGKRCFLCAGEGSISSEPESFDRDCLRGYFGDGCRLKYVPASRDAGWRSEPPESRRRAFPVLDADGEELLRMCVSVVTESEARAA